MAPWILLLLGSAPAQVPGLKVPAGFEVVQFADQNLANDIHCMTIDPKGRVVVSGRGYLRLLLDDDADGTVDRVVDFSAEAKDGAMGLFWENDHLYFTGDGGLRVLLEKGNTGQAAGPSKLVRKIKTGGEHSTHAVTRGPDGWLYVLGGDGAGIDSSFATLPTSPVRDPIGGCVVRFSPDGQKSEIVAHGFRNPYGMDFNLDGELFTFDSDNERCVSLPWYEPTRFYHVAPGGFHGWLAPHHARFFRLPPYFPDVVPPVATLGRGSPTGVVCYRNTQFPAEYGGGFFLLDWTFGKIHFLPMKAAGSTYVASPQVFLEATGANGFAPTAAAVHPKTGDLYVSIGGRGTRGAVYRIRHLEGFMNNPRPLPIKARSLKTYKSDLDNVIAESSGPDLAQRRRALESLRRLRPTLNNQQVRAVVTTNWETTDRLVRQAAIHLVRDAWPKLSDEERLEWRNQAKTLKARLALGEAINDGDFAWLAAHAALRADQNSIDILAGLRLIQRLAGDLGNGNNLGTYKEGYTLRTGQAYSKHLPAILEALLELFPTKNLDVNREAARVLGLLQAPDPRVAEMILAYMEKQTDPVEQLHYLMVLPRLAGALPKNAPVRLAEAMLRLDERITKAGLHRDLNWPLRVGELYADLAVVCEPLHQALLKHPSFGRPDHVLFSRAPGFPRDEAAKVFLHKLKTDKDYPVTAEVLRLLEKLPANAVLPVVRPLWDNAALQPTLLLHLARQPDKADHAKFVQGLKHGQPGTLLACLHALDKLPRHKEQEPLEMELLLRAWRNLADKKGEVDNALHHRLSQLSGVYFTGPEKHQKYYDWFRQRHPKIVARLDNPDGVDVAAWKKRLAAIPWDQGDPRRGQAVFQKASCASCHSGGQSVGPDLAAVAVRFGRDDLFTAILQPSKDVANRYQLLQVETTDGAVHQGVVIYDAVDVLVLHATDGQPLRLPGRRITARRPLPTSPMPAGLLDRLNDGEIADLYAYLRERK